jgi:hypothetical protein
MRRRSRVRERSRLDLYCADSARGAKAGIKLEEDKASEGAGGGGTLKIVPYTVHRLSFGDIKEKSVRGLYEKRLYCGCSVPSNGKENCKQKH